MISEKRKAKKPWRYTGFRSNKRVLTKHGYELKIIFKELKTKNIGELLSQLTNDRDTIFFR